jgi:hypothetical protein
MTAQAEIEAVAKEVITSLNNHSQIPTFSSRPDGLTLTQAYRVTCCFGRPLKPAVRE